MPAQLNITNSGNSNFLAEGAFVRWNGQFVVYLGPFSPGEPRSLENRNGFVVQDFFDSDSAARGLGSEHVLHLSSHEFSAFIDSQLALLMESPREDQNSFENISNKKAFVVRQDQLASRTDFLECFTEIKARIARGEILKAVGSVIHQIPKVPDVFTRAQIIKRLIATPENLNPYGQWDRGKGILGATPEILFQRNNRVLRTMALAGSRRSAGNTLGSQLSEFDIDGMIISKQEPGLKSLLNDPKELHEHGLVVDDLVQQLSELGEVSVSGPSVLELPGIDHLLSEITLKLRGMSYFYDIVKLLHPTPALGVFPRSTGFQWLKNFPGQNRRGRFGAPLTFSLCDGGQTLSLVAIRGLQWDPMGSVIGVGCGIVEESLFENEWNELDLKTSVILKTLGIGERS